MTTNKRHQRLIHKATKFPKPRIASLSVALDATEEAIAHQADQYALRTNASLVKGGMHPDDIENDIYMQRKVTEELFPQMFRGGFLTSVWSVFESDINDLAEYTRREKGCSSGLNMRGKGDFLDKIERFFKAKLQLEPFPDKEVRRQVKLIKDFRNALAHHNGNLDKMPEDLKKEPLNAFQTFSDLHHTFAIPTAAYNTASLTLLQGVARDLADKVYEGLHPTEREEA